MPMKHKTCYQCHNLDGPKNPFQLFFTRVLAYHKGRNQDTIPIATLFNNNETQNMLLILQFGWTQEPISTCVIKVLAYHNGKKST